MTGNFRVNQELSGFINLQRLFSLQFSYCPVEGHSYGGNFNFLKKGRNTQDALHKVVGENEVTEL